MTDADIYMKKFGVCVTHESLHFYQESRCPQCAISKYSNCTGRKFNLLYGYERNRSRTRLARHFLSMDFSALLKTGIIKLIVSKAGTEQLLRLSGGTMDHFVVPKSYRLIIGRKDQ